MKHQAQQYKNVILMVNDGDEFEGCLFDHCGIDSIYPAKINIFNCTTIGNLLISDKVSHTLAGNIHVGTGGPLTIGDLTWG